MPLTRWKSSVCANGRAGKSPGISATQAPSSSGDSPPTVTTGRQDPYWVAPPKSSVRCRCVGRPHSGHGTVIRRPHPGTATNSPGTGEGREAGTSSGRGRVSTGDRLSGGKRCGTSVNGGGRQCRWPRQAPRRKTGGSRAHATPPAARSEGTARHGRGQHRLSVRRRRRRSARHGAGYGRNRSWSAARYGSLETTTLCDAIDRRLRPRIARIDASPHATVARPAAT